MKHFKTLLLIAVLTLGFGSIQAQNKTAHINFQELVILMPEIKVMNDELAKLDKTQQDDLKAAELALKAKLAKFRMMNKDCILLRK
jgi:outer membrane protein